MTIKNDAISLFSSLARISESGSADTLEKAVEIIASSMAVKRCAISIVDPLDGKIRIRAAHGLRPDQIRLGEYLPGEGITGNVVARGKPIFVNDVSKEPLFLNRTQSRMADKEPISFMCVPMIWKGQVIGSLWIDQTGDGCGNPETCLEILRIAATLLAPAAHEGGVCHLASNNKDCRFGRFIGMSQAMKDIYAQIIQVAPSRLTVFLGGESGTGKELAARAIHEGGTRASGPFVSINCAALPENLIESELFGHEKGAFTGAMRTRMGKFEQADHGTLFLDEIGDMNPGAQAKLLRVLQDHSFERVGGTKAIHVDVRVIAATNRDLATLVDRGAFREDLFYRLNVFPIHMPPLRERTEDIPALVTHFLNREAVASRRKPPEISLGAMHILQSYSWPGNVRELENIIERAFLLIDSGDVMLPDHLPENMRIHNVNVPTVSENASLRERLEEYERVAIINALKNSNGHIGKAARNLGMTERIFSLRLDRFGINYMDFRKKNRSGN